MRTTIVLCALVLGLAWPGCRGQKQQPQQPTPHAGDSATPANGRTPDGDATNASQAEGGLPYYALKDAIGDALGGELKLVGTGTWFGVHGFKACVFRNDEVIVVSVLCGHFSSVHLRIYSPDKGMVRLYAEGSGRPEELERDQYEIWSSSSSPPPASLRGQLQLDLGVEQLVAYERRLNAMDVPSCFFNYRGSRQMVGCRLSLEESAPEWQSRVRPFIADPPPEWFELVKKISAQSPIKLKGPARRGK